MGERSIFSSGSNTISDSFKFNIEEEYELLFRLNAPKENELWSLELFLYSKKDQSNFYALDNIWKNGKSSPILFLQASKYVEKAKSISDLIKDINQPSIIKLSNNEAYNFISNEAFKLKTAGFSVHVPQNVFIGKKEDFIINIKINNTSKFKVGNVIQDNIFEFDYKVAIGGLEIDQEEFENIVKNKSALVNIKGKWVEIDNNQAEKLAKIISENNSKDISSIFRDSIKAAEYNIKSIIKDGKKEYDLFTYFFSKEEKIKSLVIHNGFSGKLRDYQEKGVSWLDFMSKLKLGALLADDMGLGKTIQIIAHILSLVENNAGPILIISPTSVVENWVYEFSRFAPKIKIKVHHGSLRSKDREFFNEVNKYNVLVTSYGLVRLDQEQILKIKWSLVIIDEAQNIKNPLAKQTDILKKIQAESRIALTGTPIENRLSDLWSLMDFLNPGYLFSWNYFKENFAKPIEIYGDNKKMEILKTALKPFILRRIKNDKTIIPELPDKIEKLEWCYLTEEQASLYKATADVAIKKVIDKDGKDRKLQIFAAITRLKQICNHPANLLGGSRELSDRSGKVNRLHELLSFIIKNKESCLIFTQYTEMGSLLYDFIKKEFSIEVLYFHGALSIKKRQEIINSFQIGNEPKIMVLSLRAGGTGITLTKATHVIHFDRWWNPAVENQATDRTYRIGQKQNVMVYKMITKGTIEEHIEKIMFNKKRLSDSIIGPSHTDIFKLNTEELRKIFELREE